MKVKKINAGDYEYRGFGIIDNNVSRTTGNVSAMRRWSIKDGPEWNANTIGNAPTLKAAIKDINDRFHRYAELQ